ncbi:radical SAM protein, partial [Extibacter muris]|nr:radical SAM protein [Extibacter muris]
MENEIWPVGIEAIIFILYKPVGLGRREKIVKKDERLARFLDAAIKKEHFYRVGFDTCFTSALIKYGESLEMSSVDACEAGRFS